MILFNSIAAGLASWVQAVASEVSSLSNGLRRRSQVRMVEFEKDQFTLHLVTDPKNAKAPDHALAVLEERLLAQSLQHGS